MLPRYFKDLLSSFGKKMIEHNQVWGATKLDADEAQGLIPIHITTQAELNTWEQANILSAENWLSRQKLGTAELLTPIFLQKLHRLMFKQTWRWAGQYRKTDKNIGVDWRTIAVELKLLFDDVLFQISVQSYSVDEIATRFHHRLVWIHPFVNGNGRHARLMTDQLLITLNATRFSWGAAQLYKPTSVRKQYINALRAADKKNYSDLLAFVRS